MSLVSSVLLVAYQGLSLGFRYWEVLSATGQKSERLLLVSQFFRDKLAESQILLLTGGQTPRATFEGTARRLAFLAPPAEGSTGHLLWLQVEVVRQPTGNSALMLRTQPLEVSKFALTNGRARDSMRAAGDSQFQEILVPDLTSFALAYQDSEAPGRWLDGWNNKLYLPDAIRLRIADTRSPWPEIIVRLDSTLTRLAGVQR